VGEYSFFEGQAEPLTWCGFRGFLAAQQAVFNKTIEGEISLI